MYDDDASTSTRNDETDFSLSRDERTWGMFCHLSALAGYVFPLGWLLGPLVVWLLKREEYEFVNDQGRESLNFQLTLFILLLICIPLAFVIIGIVLAVILGIYGLVMTIIAGVKANDGVRFRYGLNFRLIK